MANNTDVTVKNMLMDPATINVTRYPMENVQDVDLRIEKDLSDEINIPDTQTVLKIQAPEGKDLKKCYIRVKSGVDMEIIQSRTDACWTLKIIPNDLPQDAPQSTNVIVGQDEPD